MVKKYVVELEADEKEHLLGLIRKGKVAARTRRRAQILLLADEGRTDQQIASVLHCHTTTIEKTRKKFVHEAFPDCLVDKLHPGRVRKLDEKAVLILEQLACSDPGEGRARWTLQLLADRLVALGLVDSISADTIGRELKKRVAALDRKKMVYWPN